MVEKKILIGIGVVVLAGIFLAGLNIYEPEEGEDLERVTDGTPAQHFEDDYEVHEVVIENQMFNSEDLTIGKQEVVLFVNEDQQNHMIEVKGSGSTLMPEDSIRERFTEEGTFEAELMDSGHTLEIVVE